MTASVDPVAGSAPVMTSSHPAASTEGFEASLIAPSVLASVLHDVALIGTLPEPWNYTLPHVI